MGHTGRGGGWGKFISRAVVVLGRRQVDFVVIAPKKIGNQQGVFGLVKHAAGLWHIPKKCQVVLLDTSGARFIPVCPCQAWLSIPRCHNVLCLAEWQ